MVPDPVVFAAVKVLPLNEPRVVGLTEYVTGILEGVDVNGCGSPATTLTEAGLTSSDVIVMLADPVAPEPSVAVAVSVSTPAEVPATKTHEAAVVQVGIVPSPPDAAQVAGTLEVKVNEVPSSIVCDGGVTVTVVGGVDETVIVSWTVMVVLLAVSCACRVNACDPTASDVTV
jgi:hypothetical protein